MLTRAKKRDLRARQRQRHKARFPSIKCRLLERSSTSLHTNTSTNQNATATRRRRSTRGASALTELAHAIVTGQRVVFITGAGLSVASGVRPFRTTSIMKKGQVGGTSLPGIWNQVIWTTATRRSFRKDPLLWYNQFWIPQFHSYATTSSGSSVTTTKVIRPNAGHRALLTILDTYPNVCQVTQNIDALQSHHERLIEAHGRMGLYKCLGDDDDDDNYAMNCGGDNDGQANTHTEEDKDHGSESDDDDDDHPDREVHLGHRRTSRLARQKVHRKQACRYVFVDSLRADQLEPPEARVALIRLHNQSTPEPFQSTPLHGNASMQQQQQQQQQQGKTPSLTVAPRCPACGRPAMPQALLFDEGYHSHSFYQFERIEDWLAQAQVLVFVGTSFSVRITNSALERARQAGLPVFNVNIQDGLQSTSRLNASNIMGPAQMVLPDLVHACRQQEEELAAAAGSTTAAEVLLSSSLQQLPSAVISSSSSSSSSFSSTTVSSSRQLQTAVTVTPLMRRSPRLRNRIVS